MIILTSHVTMLPMMMMMTAVLISVIPYTGIIILTPHVNILSLMVTTVVHKQTIGAGLVALCQCTYAHDPRGMKKTHHTVTVCHMWKNQLVVPGQLDGPRLLPHGKCRGAAHNTCNLKLRGQIQI